MTALAPSMQAYFIDRLISQRQASPNTIAAYRHTFRLLLGFATERTGTPPSTLDIADLDAPLIAAFLEHLQTDRHNTVATRNNRLAAIHSLFAYLVLRHPEHADTIQRVLAIPAKRTEKNLLTYLTDTEVDALLAACNQATWTQLPRHHARNRRQRPHHRQGKKGQTNTAHPDHPNSAQSMACRARRSTRRAAVPDPHRQTTQPRRRRAPPRTTPPGRRQRLPGDHPQAHHDAHPPAYRRDAPPTRRQRHHRDRALARPRANLDNEHLPTRRHDPQAASNRPHQTDQHQTRPLQPPRHAPRVPRSPLTMPTFQPQKTL
jgi:hypothetical protein